MIKTIRKIFTLRFLFLAFFVFYFGLLWSRQLSLAPSGLIAGSDRTWADGAAHLSYISAFVERGFWLNEHPLYTGARFSYPPASGWLTALLVMLGIPLTISFSLVGFGLSVATLGMLYFFYTNLFPKNTSIPIIASLLFFWSGGLGFVLPFISTSTSPGAWLRLTELPDHGIRFINTIDAELLPQRAFLLGLPIGLFVLCVLWKMVIQKKISPLYLASAGLLGGLLPLAHPHSFIVMATCSVWVLLVIVVMKKWVRKFWWFFGVLFSLGLVLSLWQTRDLPGSFFWIKWGWLASDFSLPWIWFWFINWGFWLPLAIVGSLRVKRSLQLFLVPFFGLFLLCNIVVFQPYDWDNSKILTWVHLVFSGSAAWFLSYLWRKGIFFTRFLALLFFFISILSGFHDSFQLLSYEKTSIQLFSKNELIASDWVRTNTPQSSVFLTSDTHRHFVPVLTGRQIAMGYRGWLWSYGIDYSDREKDVLEMFRGGELASTLLSHYGIDYVVIGPAEKDDFYRANEAFYQNQFERVFWDGYNAIYRISL